MIGPVQQLALQECGACGRRWQTVFPGCPYCGAKAVREHMAPASGTVYSWVEVCRSLEDPPEDVPYTVVCVELETGARVLGRYGPGGDPVAGATVVARGNGGGAPTFEPGT
jgi:uncharacterized OB-fold protein